MTFHNPYHFVPVKDGARVDDLPVDDFKAGRVGQVTHDRYVDQIADPSKENEKQAVYSGRVICRVTTEGAIFIGDARQDDKNKSQEKQDKSQEKEGGPNKVEPYKLDNEPVLPASSVRGLISSIAEAASNSALRVLENKLLSHRAPMPGLSAIGIIIKETKDEDGRRKFWLRPLALPTMVKGKDGSFRLDREYHAMFPATGAPPLKVYIDGSTTLRTFVKDSPQYYYAKLEQRRWASHHTITPAAFLRTKTQEKDEFLLSQKTKDGVDPIPKQEAGDNPEQRGYTRGILRILGTTGRTDIPKTKKYELFIPCPEEIDWEDSEQPTFPILPEALEVFESIADERTEARKKGSPLPYEPRGTKRNTNAEKYGKRFQLKTGDLVYFRPDKTGRSVEEIALSSLWRKDAKRTPEYFHAISPELVPFHAGRKHISIAEQIFGFVEQREKNGQPVSEDSDSLSTPQALALAGRVRFSAGLYHPDPDDKYGGQPFGEEVTLKILDSPKPPSPALYFKQKNGQGAYITKVDLSPNKHSPQGRKFYLHQKQEQRSEQEKPWVTCLPEANPKQKSKITPLHPGRVFYFHIDFDNLSQRELGLLCYALRPTEEFRHKIGMGKSIGLGSIRIDPVGLFFIDRTKRYQETALFTAPRYHGCWLRDGEDPKSWPERYECEQGCVDHGIGTFPAYPTLRKEFCATMDKDIRRALKLLGEPGHVEQQVHTPQVQGVSGKQMEQKTYEWFVANDPRTENDPSACKEFLKPLTAASEDLPTLPRNPRRST